VLRGGNEGLTVLAHPQPRNLTSRMVSITIPAE